MRKFIIAYVNKIIFFMTESLRKMSKLWLRCCAWTIRNHRA